MAAMIAKNGLVQEHEGFLGQLASTISELQLPISFAPVDESWHL